MSGTVDVDGDENLFCLPGWQADLGREMKLDLTPLTLIRIRFK